MDQLVPQRLRALLTIGALPATGKSTTSDHAYALEFEGDKIAHLTRVCHSGTAMRD